MLVVLYNRSKSWAQVAKLIRIYILMLVETVSFSHRLLESLEYTSEKLLTAYLILGLSKGFVYLSDWLPYFRHTFNWIEYNFGPWPS